MVFLYQIHEPNLNYGVYASHFPQWETPNRFLDLKKTVAAKRCMLSLTALYIIIYKSSDDLVAGLTSPKCYDFARHCVLFIYAVCRVLEKPFRISRGYILLLSVKFACSVPLTYPRLSLTCVTSTVYYFVVIKFSRPRSHILQYNIIIIIFITHSLDNV